MNRLVCALVLAALVTGTSSRATAAQCMVDVGKKAPPFSLSMADGSEGVVLNRALAKGVPVVVIFWAWDCVPCGKELPQVQHLANELGSKVSFLLIHDGPDEEKMKTRLAELKITLPSASDDSRMKEERYCVDSLPRTFVIDKTGIVRAIFKQYDETGLRDVLAKLAAK
jgi:cytochrome c biogenesis protein CcmG, thiol:disulfide interchange protein DsbE